jgi:hypothetical protein
MLLEARLPPEQGGSRMDYVVLPRVAIGTDGEEALAVMKRTGRSALVAERRDGECVLFELPEILDGLNAGLRTLAEIKGGGAVIMSSARAARERLWSGRANLRSMVETLLDDIGGRVVLFSERRRERAAGAPLALNLSRGVADPLDIGSLRLFLSPDGISTDHIATRVIGMAQVSLALVATRHEKKTLDYLVSPAWLVCSRRKDRYDASRYAVGAQCPSGDGGRLQ